MAVFTPKNWWEPLHKEEKIWVYIVIFWAVVLLLMMPLGHLISRQNVSQESYLTTPEEFQAITDKFIAKYQRKDAAGNPVTEKGIAVVDAPVGKESFLLASAWRYEPILVLKKNQEYRIHMSSRDYQHGFSLQPQNLNFQMMPGYDYVLTFTPRQSGKFSIVCNEYCFYATPQLGHDTMVGQIWVED